MLFDFLQKSGATMELAELIVELGRAVEEISTTIIHTSTGKVGSKNVYGEDQIAMDVKADEIMGRYLKTNPYVAAYCSEEMDALYAVYGPRSTLVLSVVNGVHEFVLTSEGWELSRENMKLSGEKKYFAPGNLRATKDREDYFKLVSFYIKEQYTLRYSGGMVPYLNHILQKGSGVFLYPGMPSAPHGKLRLLYECGPMA